MQKKPDPGLSPTRSPALEACVEDEVLEWYRMTPQERWAESMRLGIPSSSLEAALRLSPIPKVLSTMRGHSVQALLMGGQACILYGAAEFSRDADFAILASPENLHRLRSALEELQAEGTFRYDMNRSEIFRSEIFRSDIFRTPGSRNSQQTNLT